MLDIDKVIVFDIWGDYAHFRRIETTTSPLTYSIPTGTALSGMLGGLLGLQRDSYYSLFSPDNARLAVRLLNPVKKTRMNINLINTKMGFYLWDIADSSEQPRSPTPFEFLKEPKYRVYFWSKNREIYDKLKELLQSHKSFYTPYLGISELIADFKFVGEFKANIRQSKEDRHVHTVVRTDKGKVVVEEGKKYCKERIPIFMNHERVVQEYATVFFEVNGNSIKVRDAVIYEVGDENVIFI